MAKRIEIRIAGFGGQGVILMGIILGKAWALFEGKEAAMTQSFGPEARGGACSAQVVLEEGKVLYPYTTQADILVAMSQEAYHVYASSLKPGGTLLIEEELVKLEKALPAQQTFAIPATRLAEEAGRRMVTNIVMLGFLTATTGTVSKEAMKQAVESSVPKGTEALNLKAFEMGYAYGLERYALN
jgi:2-oxoglutarate ferredoxin oxidoreductase subunit gamma